MVVGGVGGRFPSGAKVRSDWDVGMFEQEPAPFKSSVLFAA